MYNREYMKKVVLNVAEHFCLLLDEIDDPPNLNYQECQKDFKINLRLEMRKNNNHLSEKALEKACEEIKKIKENSKELLNINPTHVIIPHIESIELAHGKYTIQSCHGVLSALRYGKPWRSADLIGDNLVGAMVDKILMQTTIMIELKETLEKLACLGNGNQYGNSLGNSIAQEALKKLSLKTL